MKILNFPGFNIGGSANVPQAEQFVAFGIAPSSEVDTCLVGGVLLGPCTHVPPSSKLEAVRGYRTPLASFPAKDQVGQTLAIAAYEKCDGINTPGPRAMARVAAYMETGTWGATAATAGRALRLPFSGRKNAMFAVRRTSEPGNTDTNLVIRGIRYLHRDLIRKSSAYSAFVEEELDTVWGGAGAQPVSTVDANNGLGRMVYVEDEAFDELELWVWGGNEAGGNLLCVGEAYGERVL